MSKLWYCAIFLALLVLLACSSPESTPAPTAESVPAPTPAATAESVPAPATTPAPAATPMPTDTPMPTEEPPKPASGSGTIAPLNMEDPEGFMSELSAAEQSCISANFDPQQLVMLLSGPELTAPEETSELIQCLEHETLLRLFLTGFIGQTGPLSEETSTCVRSGFVGFDIRAVMLATFVDSDEEAAMIGSMASFFLTLSCLNEEEWQIASPSLGLGPDDRESLRCVTEELGGPQGVAAALQTGDAGPPMAFIAAATGCNLQMMGEPPGETPAPTKDDPGAYTQAFVNEAIQRYERDGRQAAIDHYNTAQSVDGEWYVFIVDQDGITISHHNPQLRGRDPSLRVDANGYFYGDELLGATEAGKWVDYVILNPETGENQQKHTWAIRHDGLLFGSGWYEKLGAVKVAPGEAIQIRSMHVLTGLGDLGVPSQRGVALALDDYGPIKGHDVSMGVGLDSLCTGEGGRAAANAVAGDPQVVGVIGTSCSVAAAAASPILSEAGLVMISSSNTAPSLTSDLRGNAGSNYYPGYYRTSNNDLHEAGAVAQFAYNELGLRKMAAIHDGDPYTSGLTGAFTTAFEELGGSVAVATVSRGDTDMVPVLTEIAAGSPDGLFFPLFQEEGAHVVRQAGQVPGLEDITMIGGAALLVSEFLAIPESEGVYFPGPELNFYGNTNEATGKSNEALVADYWERYGEAPTSAYLAHAYDAATVLLRAIEEVAVGDEDMLSISRAELREELTGVTGFRGVIGVISCDEFGDCGTSRVHMAHHTDSSVTDIAELPVVYSIAP